MHEISESPKAVDQTTRPLVRARTRAVAVSRINSSHTTAASLNRSAGGTSDVRQSTDCRRTADQPDRDTTYIAIRCVSYRTPHGWLTGARRLKWRLHSRTLRSWYCLVKMSCPYNGPRKLLGVLWWCGSKGWPCSNLAKMRIPLTQGCEAVPWLLCGWRAMNPIHWTLNMTLHAARELHF